MNDKPVAPDGLECFIGSKRLREILDVSERRLWTLRAMGKLPPADLQLGRSLKWRTSTIARWLDSQRKDGR